MWCVFEEKGVWFRGSGAHAEGRARIVGGVALQDCSKWKSHLLELFSTYSTVHVLHRQLTSVITSALDLDGMRLKLRTCRQGTTGLLENTVWFGKHWIAWRRCWACRYGFETSIWSVYYILKVFPTGALRAHLTYILLCHVLLLLDIFGSFYKLLRSRANCRWCCTDLKTLHVYKGLLKRKKVSEKCAVGKYPKLLVIWLQPVRTQVVFL